MSEWSAGELADIANADDLHISPFREDGVTYGTPTWIWSVVVDRNLYVRAYNGTNSRWYRAAMQQKAGCIRVAGVERKVTFLAAPAELNKSIDAAYRVKYASSPYLTPMIGAKAQAATVRIDPL